MIRSLLGFSQCQTPRSAQCNANSDRPATRSRHLQIRVIPACRANACMFADINAAGKQPASSQQTGRTYHICALLVPSESPQPGHRSLNISTCHDSSGRHAQPTHFYSFLQPPYPGPQSVLLWTLAAQAKQSRTSIYHRDYPRNIQAQLTSA
jgi:hypothetical protein